MKNTLIYSFILATVLAAGTLLYSNSGISAEQSRQNPFDIAQFEPSKENKALYNDYRKTWLRLTGFELSSLHWNQFIAVFINQSPDIYRKNHIEYLRTSQDDWDDDDEDEEEEGSGAEKNNYKTYPVGTMIAKEGYTSDKGKPGDPTFLVIMKKREPGYDPKSGNWEYMKFTTDGKTLLRGKGSEPHIMAECANCHINVAERDYIFTTFFSGTIRN
jgi:hypothetical protein